MNRLNEFFRRLYSSPSLIWKAGAGLLFIGFGLVIFFDPQLVQGLSDMSRTGFAGLLVAYGIFRLVTFYMEYKNTGGE